MSGLFPLTPSLSLRERGNPVQSLDASYGASFTTRQGRNRTARSAWSAWSLLPLSNQPTPCDSASKLDALQTLRAAVHHQKPSQPANKIDYCSAKALATILPLPKGEGQGEGGKAGRPPAVSTPADTTPAVAFRISGFGFRASDFGFCPLPLP